MTRPLAYVLALTLSLSLAPQLASAQALYVVSAPTNGTAPTYTGWQSFTFSDEDDGGFTFNLPFTFTYFGQNYTQLGVNTNGVMFFGSSSCKPFGSSNCTSGPTTFPASSDPNNFVAYWWDDMEYMGTPGGQWTSFGTPGDRTFSFKFSGWAPYNATSGERSLQVDLQERTGAIVIYYGAISGSSSNDNAIAAFENANGSVGQALLPCATTSSKCTSSDWPANKFISIAPAIDPDLVVMEVNSSALTLIDINGQPGFGVDVSAVVKNQGQNAASNFQLDVYLSTDAVINPSTDTLLGSSINTLTVQGRSQETFAVPGLQFVRPAGANFYLGVVVDPNNTVNEALETNNIGVSTPYSNGIDLTGSVSGYPAGGPGDLVDVRVVIRNRGVDGAGGFDYNLWLSPDATLERTSDTKFPGFPRRIQAIGGGETIDETIQAELPGVPDGAYYYILEVDPVTALHAAGEIAETSETNNTSVSPSTVTMSAADLVVENIKVRSPIAPYPETTDAYFGEQLRISFTLKNAGGAQARDFFVGIYLSDNGVITTHDVDMTPVGSILEHLTFNGAQTQNFEIDLTVPDALPNGDPLPDGNYYVGVIADAFGAVAEGNETNNLNRAENEILIRQPAMDLTPVRVEAPAAAAAGERMPIRRIIRNIGNRGTDAVGPAHYRYVLSSNEIISVEDIPLQVLSDSSLAIDGVLSIGVFDENEDTDLVQVPPDISPGTYFVGLVVDPLQEIRELDETNNSIGSVGVVEIASSSLYVETSSLPDAIVGADYLQQMVAAGGYGSYSWAIEPGQGELPEGLALSEQGILSGKPVHDGVSVFTVRVSSGERTALARLVLRTVPPSGSLGILSSRLPTAVKGIEYAVSLVAVGGVKPYTWQLVEGALPGGLELNGEGLISGKLTRSYADPVSFKVSVTDLQGNQAIASVSLRAVDPGALFIATVKLAEAVVGINYQAQLQPMDSSLVWKIRSGSLPEGLKLSNGAIIGTPTRVGIFPLRIEVSDEAGRGDSADFILTVLPRPASFSPLTIPEARIGEAYFLDLSASTKPHTSFLLYSGRLPPGLSLSVSGRVTGTVEADASPGSYDFVAQITEESGQVLLVPLTVRVLARPIVIEPESTGCSAGGAGALPLAALFALFAPLALRRRGSRVRKAMLSGLVLASISSLPIAAWAVRYDVNVAPGNSFEPIVGVPLDISGATAQTTVTLPFSFRYWNVPHSSVNVGCRGYLAFGSGSATLEDPKGIPTTSLPHPIVAPWWGKWLCEPGAVTHEVSGVAPFRVVTFQWNNVWYKDDTAQAAHGATFQARLFETTGKIEFAYGPSNHGLFADSTQGSDVIKAAVGIQASSSLGISGLPCTTAQQGSTSGAKCQPTDYPQNSVITFTQPADLTMPRVYADEIGFAGVPIRVGATILNKGGRDAASVVARFFLSADGTLDVANDAEIGTTRPINLAVGQRREVVIMPTLPLGLSPGSYFILAKVDPDSWINEDDETNNVGPNGGLAFSLGDATPDLIPGTVSVPATAHAGESIQVSGQILNIGNAFAGPCSDAADCGNSICDEGRCRAPCSEQETCADGLLCDTVKGICEVQQCGSDAECPARERCDAGVCRAREIRYALYLSDNPVISLADTRLTPAPGSFALSAGIEAFGANARVDTIELPAALASGIYYIGMIVDPADELQEITDVNNATTAAAPITVVSGSVSLLTGTLPDALVQSPYSVQLEAAGGSGSYEFTLSSGALPPGLTLSRSGSISGVPTAHASEPYSFEVEVSSAGVSSKATLNLLVQPSGVPLTVLTTELPAAEFGQPYSVALSAVGGHPPYRWALAQDEALPPGLALGPDGRIEGVPALDRASPDPKQPPEFVFQIEVTDAQDGVAAHQLSLKVVSPERLQISTSVLPDGFLGKAYAVPLYVAGGRAPYVWSIVESRLLPMNPMDEVDESADLGVKLISDKKGARLNGVPNYAGTWVVTLKVVDGSGAEDNATSILNVRFEHGLEIETQALPDAIANKTYYARLLAKGGDGSEDIRWSVVCMPVFNDKGEKISCRDGLPPGLVLSEDGTLSSGDAAVASPEADEAGNIPARKTYSFLVRAQDDNNRSALRGLSVTIRADQPLYRPDSTGCGCGTAAAGLPNAMLLAFLGAASLLRRRRN